MGEIDPSLKMHDFRMVGGDTHKNLVFDVAVPFDCKISDADILQRIKDGVALLDGHYDTVATIERQNIE